MRIEPWFYDFKKTFLSKPTISISFAVILIQGAIAYDDVLVDNAAYPHNLAVSTTISSLAYNLSNVGLFIDLLIVLLAFLAFGNERIKGVFDYVLAQPVSRVGLVSSRYLSILCSISVASIGSFLVIDLILQGLNGSSFSSHFVLAMLLTYPGEIAAMLSIAFIFSYIAKSSGILIGSMISLWTIFDLLYQYITNGIANAIGVDITNNSIFTSSYIHFSIVSYFLSPSGLPSVGYVLSMGWFEQNSPINPNFYGVSVASLAVTEALWILVPLGFLLFIASKLD